MALNWTILWDIRRRPGKGGWSRAVEANEAEALKRAERFLKLGFVVYEIRDAADRLFMEEAAVSEHFKPASPLPEQEAGAAWLCANWHRRSESANAQPKRRAPDRPIQREKPAAGREPSPHEGAR
jgi:hypothetical protein